MKITVTTIPSLALFLAVGSFATLAHAQQPQENTVKELLDVMQARRTLESSRPQVVQQIDALIQARLQNTSLNEKQKEIIQQFKSKVSETVYSELKWEKQQPAMVRIYQSTFTDDEIQGMLTFYKSPIGIAVTNKMPTVVQASIVEMGKMQSQLAPKISEAVKVFIQEMMAAK